MLLALAAMATIWVFDPAARIMLDHSSQGSSVYELGALWSLSSHYSEVGFARPTTATRSPEFTKIARGSAVTNKPPGVPVRLALKTAKSVEPLLTVPGTR